MQWSMAYYAHFFAPNTHHNRVYSDACTPNQTLEADGMNLPNDGFGGKNALALDEDIAVVGAPGAESVFLYYRTRVAAGASDEDEVSWTWGQSPVKTLMSSDFDYDMVHLLKIVHRQVGVRSGATGWITMTSAVGWTFWNRQENRPRYE